MRREKLRETVASGTISIGAADCFCDIPVSSVWSDISRCPLSKGGQNLPQQARYGARSSLRLVLRTLLGHAAARSVIVLGDLSGAALGTTFAAMLDGHGELPIHLKWNGGCCFHVC